MSPKKMTNLALIVAAISILGIIFMALLRPGWGLLSWWPVAGLGFSVVLIVIALVKGASMATQRRIEMVDMMNDCNAGVLNSDYS